MRHVSVLGPVAAGLFFSSLAFGATPASQSITLPAKPGTYVYTWSGTAPAGVIAQAVGAGNLAGDSGLGTCGGDVTNTTNDVEDFNVTVPQGFYGSYVVSAHYRIAWTQDQNLPAALPVLGGDGIPDLSMTLAYNDAAVTYSDGSTASEEVTTGNPQTGKYSVLVCSAISPNDTPYTGTLTLTVNSVADVSAPPSAAATGLEFSATLVDELQYFEGEPLVTTDLDGTIYTCGPAGSGYPAADYAQASLDGGDQFNRLGDPTTGRMGLMGGGDCAMATGLERNADGNYQLAYSGLSNLLQFTVSTSPDKGKTLTNVPFSTTAPLADRQWLAFTDAMNVFHSYNNEQSFGVVHHSSDGGLTYEPATIVISNPSRLGPIRSMAKAENPITHDSAALYFPWVAGTTMALAVSPDAGATWHNCLVGQSRGRPDQLFPVADHDSAGNIYYVYTDAADYNTYMLVIPASQLAKCDGDSGASVDATTLTSQLTPISRTQMNRDKAVTTVMPWVAAGGAPGRVAVSFYGSPIPGAVDDATLPHVWNVFVSQSLDALSAAPSVAQVKATTHPLHYDQICVGGVGCTTGGDRSLSDFFSIAYNKKTGELNLTFDRSGKKPGDGSSNSGPITATAFARQIAGPSNGGGTVARNGRTVVRRATADPTGDAYGGYSNLVVAQDRYQLAALDLTGVSIDPALDLETRKALDGGGITVTLHVKDLSDGALADALSQSSGRSLVWMFYYWDGFTPHAAAATWDGSSFTFGYSGAVEQTSCVAEEAVAVVGCSQYKLDTVIGGTVDQANGTIEMTLPLSMIKTLADVPAPARSPAELNARAGDRIHSAAAYTFVNLTGTSADPSQSLMPVDNTAAQDFVIPPGLAKPAESACALPGVTVATSPAGSTSDGLPTAQDDLRSVSFAEPADQPGKLVVTMKMDNLNPAPPPGYRWITYFNVPGDQSQYWVGMSTAGENAATPVFQYGTREALDAVATTAGSYTVLGTIDGNWAPDGTVQLVVDTNTAPFVLKAGDVLSGISGSIRRSSPDATSDVGLTVDSADGFNYTVVKNQCAASVSGGGGKAGESKGVLLGGALGLLTLLPLAGAGLARRRKR